MEIVACPHHWPGSIVPVWGGSQGVRDCHPADAPCAMALHCFKPRLNMPSKCRKAPVCCDVAAKPSNAGPLCNPMQVCARDVRLGVSGKFPSY